MTPRRLRRLASSAPPQKTSFFLILLMDMISRRPTKTEQTAHKAEIEDIALCFFLLESQGGPNWLFLAAVSGASKPCTCWSLAYQHHALFAVKVPQIICGSINLRASNQEWASSLQSFMPEAETVQRQERAQHQHWTRGKKRNTVILFKKRR